MAYGRKEMISGKMVTAVPECDYKRLDCTYLKFITLATVLGASLRYNGRNEVGFSSMHDTFLRNRVAETNISLQHDWLTFANLQLFCGKGGLTRANKTRGLDILSPP